MILFFDTETTGLPDFKARSADPNQPHIVQLALALYSDDGAEIEHHSVIVRPDGWTIPPEISKIHGITQERAMRDGVPEVDAVVMYIAMLGRSSLRVAHNESFDRRIMRIAMTRVGMSKEMILSLEDRPAFCTCNAAKTAVNAPPTDRMIAAGFTGPKSPKLEECMKFFFNEELPGAHDALIDLRACARVYFHLNPPAKAAA